MTDDASDDICAGRLSEIDAFLYGLPGGMILAVALLVCFIAFGRAITARRANPNNNVSASSNTRVDKELQLGKKRKRGPPPSSDLRPVDVNLMASQSDAPDDIKAMMLGKTPRKSSRASVGSLSR